MGICDELQAYRHHEAVADAFESGLLVSGGGGNPNPLLVGLQAVGFIVNCPIMALD